MQIVHYITISFIMFTYLHRSPQEGPVVLLSCGMLRNRSCGQLSHSSAAVCFSTAHHRATATITEFALRPSPCERGERSRGTEWVHSVCNEWCTSLAVTQHPLPCLGGVLVNKHLTTVVIDRCASILPGNQPSSTCPTAARQCTTTYFGRTGTPRCWHKLLSLEIGFLAIMKGKHTLDDRSYF